MSQSSNVFVSYSRRDGDFAKQLVNALAKHTPDRDIWVDWEDIPKAADWLQEIYQGIEASDTFLFLTSRHSLMSEICNYELQYALQHNKKIIPVIREQIQGDVQTLVREAWDGKEWQPIGESNWTALGHLNWLFFDEDDKFDSEFDALTEAIDTDLDYIKAHTRLQIRAREWQTHGESPSFLAFGDELTSAEAWLIGAEGKQPPPTDLHRTFITTSRKIEDEQEARQRRLQTLIRAASIAAGVLLVVAIGAGVLSFNAIDESNIANTAQADALLQADIASTAEQEALLQAQFASTSEAQAQIANTQSAIEIDNAQIANTQSAIIRQEAQDFADSLSLAFRGQDLNNNGSSDLGLRIAYEASLIDTPIQTQRILAEIAFSDFSIRQRFVGHPALVYSIAYSPDGQTVASGSSTGEVLLWDVATGEEIMRFAGHSAIVSRLDYSTNSQHVASSSFDGTAFVWDANTGEVIYELTGHNGETVTSVRYSDDGRFLASMSEDGTVIIWDAETGRQRRTFLDTDDDVIGGVVLNGDIAFSPDGQTIATSSVSGILIWNLRTGDVSRRIENYFQPVTTLAFSNDGSTLYAGSWDSTLIAWDVTTGEQAREYIGHSDRLNSVALSEDEQLLMSSSWDGQIILWDATTGDIIRRFDGQATDILSLAFSPIGNSVLTGSWNGTLFIWDMTTGEQRATLLGHGDAERLANMGNVMRNVTEDSTDDIYGIIYSANGEKLFSSASDNSIIQWDVATGDIVQRYTPPVDELNATGKLALSADETRILSDGRTGLNVWDVATGEVILENFGVHDSFLSDIAISPDGQTIATGSWDGTAVLWDVATGERLHTLDDHTGEVYEVTFSPDGQTIATGSRDTTIILWDVATGEALRTFEGHLMAVETLAFSADGGTMASGSWDSSAILWDVTTGDIVQTFSGHADWVVDVSFSPDDSLLATASSDNTAIVWDVATGQQLRLFDTHIEGVESVAFSPDGQTIATASRDGRIILWRLDTIEELQAWIRDNRYMPDLTCEERLVYGLRPCDDNTLPATPTLVPTSTP